jgi:hypothetical protein
MVIRNFGDRSGAWSIRRTPQTSVAYTNRPSAPTTRNGVDVDV